MNDSLLTYSEYGVPEGAPVFFFHGWPGSAIQGKFLDQVAKEKGLRIIAVNRPGICGSVFIEKRKLADWPEMIAGLAKQLQVNKYSIIAVSGGGPYALACAALNPESVEKVLIVCGAPLLSVIPPQKKLFWVYRLLIVLQKTCPRMLRVMIDVCGYLWPLKLHLIVLRFLASTFHEKDRQVFEKKDNFKIMLQSMEDEICAGGKVLITDAQIYLDPPGFKLSDIRKPIVWWHGHKDRNIPIEAAREMVKQLPTAELIETEDDGHFSIAITELAKIVRSVF